MTNDTYNGHNTIVWIDTETTGLDYAKEALLEIAVVVTDNNLNILGNYSSLIKTPKRKLRRMNDYVRTMHTQTGLLYLLPSAKKSLADVEGEIIEFLSGWGLTEKLLLGGNSVHFDRRMLEPRMPRLMAMFTHQNLDVSSIGLVVKRWTPNTYEYVKSVTSAMSQTAHRALSDLLMCIESLRQYRSLSFTNGSEDYLTASRGE